MINNKYLEEFKIDLVKQYMQGKQKRKFAKNMESLSQLCGDGYANMPRLLTIHGKLKI